MQKLVNMKIRLFKFKNSILGIMRENGGQGTVDTAIIVLLSVVLGALLLAGLYALMDDTVLPTLTEKIQEMFNYSD